MPGKHSRRPGRRGASLAWPQMADGDELDVLLAQVGRADRTAFATFYDRAAGPVFGVIRRVLRDRSMAEEVMQEVMIEVWRTAPRFDSSKGSAASWVITMARRRAVDRVRSEQSARRRNLAAGLMADATTPDLEDDILADDDRRRVRVALSDLTDLQRQAIELAYVEGHTYREVAESLQVPLGTVKSRIRDGLARLAATMGVT